MRRQVKSDGNVEFVFTFPRTIRQEGIVFIVGVDMRMHKAAEYRDIATNLIKNHVYVNEAHTFPHIIQGGNEFAMGSFRT